MSYYFTFYRYLVHLLQKVLNIYKISIKKTLYTLLIISLLTVFGANAQSKVSYDNSKWFLGLNAGGTYHINTEVDVHDIYSAGLGFTLGKSFNMK